MRMIPIGLIYKWYVGPNKLIASVFSAFTSHFHYKVIARKKGSFKLNQNTSIRRFFTTPKKLSVTTAERF